MVYATDLKSVPQMRLSVRIRSPVPHNNILGLTQSGRVVSFDSVLGKSDNLFHKLTSKQIYSKKGD